MAERARWLTRVGWLLLAAALLAPGPGRGGERALVGVLLSADAPGYRGVLDGLRAGLDRDGGPAAYRLEVATLEQGVNRDAVAAGLAGARLVVAVGTRAARAARRLPPDIPVLCTFIPKAAFEDVFRGGDGGRRVAAIYLDQPLPRQFAFVRELMPGIGTVGVLFGPESAARRSDLAAAAHRAGLGLETAVVAPNREPVEAMKAVVHKADALLAVPDATVLTPNRAKWLLYMAYRRRTPVIGFSAPYVKAGALGALYSTPEQIGQQTGRRVRAAMEGGTVAVGASAYPEAYSVAVNRFAARALGIRVADEDTLKEAVARREGTLQ